MEEDQMKIAVFGSTGGNGRLVLAEGIRRGHEVTAFARNAAALAGLPGLAAVVEGDGRDRDAAEKAVAGQAAVIVTVSGRGEADAVAGIARTVTAAMETLGVPRLVAASAYGMVATRPYVLAGLVRRIFAAGFADQAAADQVIAASQLDWTILRGTRLTARPGRGPGRRSTGLFTTGPYSLARSAFAAALLDLAEERTHVRQIVNITG
ncbi:MAG TPA: NAD(P)H-binding protein [Trebonia sp.]|jgi:putative NADH-flavin reductase|nr:NAD(P)H-binding protein [Trebonia sp.]